jgi:hypothetical protein
MTKNLQNLQLKEELNFLGDPDLDPDSEAGYVST